jgi:rubredoxin
MAESAYRDAVAEAGKGQTKMTEGWKVLGLDKEVAKRIFDETKALGYLSPDELWKKEEQDAAMEKFAAEERRRKELRETIDKDGNLIDPNATVDPDKLITDEDLNKNRDHVDDDKDELGGSSTGPAMAKECGNCGYTLFIAKGREAKFFPSGFTCPQCGGARDQFKDVDMDV